MMTEMSPEMHKFPFIGSALKKFNLSDEVKPILTVLLNDPFKDTMALRTALTTISESGNEGAVAFLALQPGSAAEKVSAWTHQLEQGVDPAGWPKMIKAAEKEIASALIESGEAEPSWEDRQYLRCMGSVSDPIGRDRFLRTVEELTPIAGEIAEEKRERNRRIRDEFKPANSRYGATPKEMSDLQKKMFTLNGDAFAERVLDLAAAWDRNVGPYSEVGIRKMVEAALMLPSSLPKTAIDIANRHEKAAPMTTQNPFGSLKSEPGAEVRPA